MYGGDAKQCHPQRFNSRVRTSYAVEKELEVSGQHRVLRRVGHDYAKRVVAVMTDLWKAKTKHSFIDI